MTSKEKSTGYTEVFTWGSDHAGQMGLAGKKPGRTYLTPKFCSFNVIIHSISCGDEHSAFIASNGYIYTMGSNADGRLGISSRNVKSTASPCLVEVLSRYKAIKVSCGFGHTAAVVETGELFTWGLGADGQLGIGSINDHHSPQLVTYLNQNTGKTLNVITVDIDCGARHTAAVTESGELYMFGSSDYGQLGTGKTDKEVFPVKIDLYSKVVSASSGVKHTLILTEHGKVYACGGNSSGELGTGNKRSSLIFTKVAFVNDTNIKKVGAGSHSAAVSESGELYIWGTGTFGEFLQPQKMSGIKTPVVDAAIGNGFGCAIDIGGQILTWGSNKNGELGLGDTDPRLVPTQVSSLHGKRVTNVSCGGTFSMALGITIQQKSQEESLSKSRYIDEADNSLSRKDLSRGEYEMKRNQSYDKFDSRDLPRPREDPKKSYTPRAMDQDYQNYRNDFQRFGNDNISHRPTFANEAYDKSPDIKRVADKSPKTPIDANYPPRRNYDDGYSPLNRNPSYSRYDLTREKMEQAIVNVSFEAEKDMFKAHRETKDQKIKNITPEQSRLQESTRLNPKDQIVDQRIKPFEEPKRIYEETRDFDQERTREHNRDKSAGRTPREVDYPVDESRLAKENRILKDTISDLKVQLIRAEKAQLEGDEMRKSAIEKRYEKLEREFAELDKRYLELERSSQADREALKRAFDEDHSQKDRFNKISIDNQKVINSLEGENKRLNEKINKMSDDFAETEKEREFLRRKVDELQRKSDRQSAEFNDALKQREDDIERVLQEKKELQNTLDELTSSLRKYGKDTALDKETIDRLKDEKQRDAKLIDNLKYDVEALKNKISGIERAKDEILRDYEDKIKGYREENMANNDEIRVLKGEITLRNAEIEESSLRLKHVEKLYEDKKIEIKELRSLIGTLESSIQTKNQEIKYLKNTIEELQYKSNKYRFEEIDASRISPNKSLNLNETNDFSKAEDLASILKKDPRFNNPSNKALSGNTKQRTGGYEQNKTKDTLHFSEHESLWFNSKKSALHEDDLKHSPYRKKESPISKPYEPSPVKEVRQFDERDRDRDRKTTPRNEGNTARRYHEADRMETSAAQAKMQEIGDAASKLMDLLNLDKEARFDGDKSTKVMETIREEDSASAGRSAKHDLHYTAKFSQRENSFNTTGDRHYDLKTLAAVEIPLDGQPDEDSANYDIFNKRTSKIVEEVRTPDEKQGEKTNLKDLKVKLQDLQKNKLALEQRMQDFEKRLQDSKKKPT